MILIPAYIFLTLLKTDVVPSLNVKFAAVRAGLEPKLKVRCDLTGLLDVAAVRFPEHILHGFEGHGSPGSLVGFSSLMDSGSLG
jgi:hypothetical protein